MKKWIRAMDWRASNREDAKPIATMASTAPRPQEQAPELPRDEKPTAFDRKPMSAEIPCSLCQRHVSRDRCKAVHHAHLSGPVIFVCERHTPTKQ